MLKSIINPNLSGKRFSLILGMMLIMLLAMSTGLMAQTSTPPSNYATSSGLSGDPYFISSLDNLYWLSQTSGDWDKYYEQTADIDATSTNTWHSGAGFSPIGNSTTQFTGNYNGQGHTIDALFINRGTTDEIGLFGESYEATFSNIGLINVDITGQHSTGSIVGKSGILFMSNCYSTGSINGQDLVGGMTGYSCYHTAISHISDNYSNCTVTGNHCVGGFIGWASHSSPVNRCYSTGLVTAPSSPGGLIACIGSTTVNNSFWDTQTSGQSSSAGGTGKTTAQMKTSTTFTDASWDFTIIPIWKIDGTNNDGYPYLGWESYASAPIVTTQAVSSIAATTATGNGNITDLGAPNPTQHGVCWNTTGIPTIIADNKTEEGLKGTTGAFTTSMTGLFADTTYYVRAYATNTVGTAYGNEMSFKTSEDGTGVLPDVQDAGPNGGDGNGDGIKDSKQTTVASLPSATPSEGYLTVEITNVGCNQIEKVKAYTYQSVGTGDPGYSYPFGLLGFEIPCASATVRIYYHCADSLGGFTYRKYGPTPADWGTSLWYTMPGATFGTEEIGGETVPYAEFVLTESELGDDTNGPPIIDQGGPARPGGPATVPTLNEWGMIILSLLMAVSAFIVIRRRQQS